MRRAIALLAAGAAVTLAGCTTTLTDSPLSVPALKLVSYTSCDELLASVREAAKLSVGPYGFIGGNVWFDGAMARGGSDAVSGAMPPAQQQAHSGTNNHERGVDEPDLVKTDGRRILVVFDGTLSVIDALTKQLIHRVPVDRGATQLLLQGDRALLLSPGGGMAIPGDAAVLRLPGPYRATTRVQLVDLGGSPRVIGDYEIAARLIDARQVGGTARVVVSSVPSIEFPQPKEDATEQQRIESNQDTIGKAPIGAWLPEIKVNGARTTLDCSDVSRPREFSGASLVTLLSFNLAASTLDAGEPVAVLADGETVYGSGDHLYLANDQRWRAWRGLGAPGDQKFKPQTDLYQFDVTSARPVFAASGSVPGWLLNQYSMSEFDGVLRVATTDESVNASAVYTLRRDGGTLKRLGTVGGLGKDERIYAVRFLGKVGYVVTFRQVDPLYTIDLADPAKPRVVGELKIPGYSAYLHPVSDTRLIGVGQDATEEGRVQGAQVSLFDVGDLAQPRRVAQHKVPQAYSEAEHDPHAFLYWPDAKLLVIPVNTDAMLLTVEDQELRPVGRISHHRDYAGQIRRSLVIGDTLWTVSQAGAMASTLDGTARLAWVPL